MNGMRALPLAERLGLPARHVGIGDCAFATRPMLFVTVLGSCVGVTFHHPDRGAGGLFHAMLPVREASRGSARPCTFADAAVELMLQHFAERGMAARELTVKIFGGACTASAEHEKALCEILDVGRQNVEAALTALSRHGLEPAAQDVFGRLGRKIHFSTGTGEVWRALLDPLETSRLRSREQRR